jgi:hypothetical protein
MCLVLLVIAQVPSEEWFCASCIERHAMRAPQRDLLQHNIEAGRHKSTEDMLITKCLEAKADGLNPFATSSDEVRCFPFIGLSI